MKPIKREIKVWVLADSSKGNFSQQDVYTGHKNNTTEHCLSSKVGLFDHFFTSISLIEDL